MLAADLLILIAYLVVPGVLWFVSYRMEKRLPQWRRERLRHPGRRFIVLGIAGSMVVLAVAVWVGRQLDSGSWQSTAFSGALFCLAPIVLIVRYVRVARWQPDQPGRVADEAR